MAPGTERYLGCGESGMCKLQSLFGSSQHSLKRPFLSHYWVCQCLLLTHLHPYARRWSAWGLGLDLIATWDQDHLVACYVALWIAVVHVCVRRHGNFRHSSSLRPFAEEALAAYLKWARRVSGRESSSEVPRRRDELWEWRQLEPQKAAA